MTDLTKKRPAGVPAEAKWNTGENEWQLGTMKSGGKKKPPVGTGEWRYWREDGSLCCVASFDDNGHQHGLHERYHEDGTLAFRANWKHGYKEGHVVHIRSSNPTSEDYPYDELTWRFEYDVKNRWSEKNLRWFLEDGTECTSKGIPVATAYDLDSMIAKLNPIAFLDSDAPAVSKALGNERQLAEDILGLRQMWGVTRPEVDKLLAYACETDNFTVVDCARTFEPEDNVWRDWIAHPHENIHEEISAALIGAVQIGRLGDSDGVYATVFQGQRPKPTPNAVFLWSHDTYYVDDILSLTLDEFAYRTAVSAACEAERLSPTATRAAWKKLAGRAHIDWGGCSGLDLLTDEDDRDEPAETGDHVDDSEFKRDLDPENTILTYFWRGQWILWLLTPDGDRDFDTVRDCFRPGWNPTLDDATHKDWIESGTNLPQLAIYLLWRYFWFDQPERLADVCATHRNHPARVVRDLVVLLDEIAEGKTQIGQIKDILAVRQEFLKLDLCPENEAQRSEKTQAQASEKEEEMERLRRQLGESTASGLEAVLDLAWSNVRDPEAIDEIEKTARAFPGHEFQWRTFDWVRAKGYERANQRLENEARSVGSWLAKNDSHVVQPFAWSRIHASDYPTAELLLTEIAKQKDALDPRFKDVLLDELEHVEKYHRKRALATRLLAGLGVSEAVPRLCKIIDDFLPETSGMDRWNLSLAIIPWKEFLVEIAKALAILCGDKSEHRTSVCNALRRAVAVCFESGDDAIAAEMVHTLFLCGETDLMSDITRLMASSNGDIACVALRTAEAIAVRLNKKQRARILDEGFINHHKHDNAAYLLFERAVAVLSAKDTKTPIDFAQALEDARELGNYGTEGWRLWRVVECETVSRCKPTELESISPYLYSTDPDVRQAAERAFAAHGVTPPARNVLCWVDIWKIEDTSTSIEEIATQVAALIADPQSVDRTPACAWLWEHPHRSAAASLAKSLDSELDKYKSPQDGEYVPSELEWLIRAVIKHSEHSQVKDVLERCKRIDDSDLSRVIESETRLQKTR